MEKPLSKLDQDELIELYNESVEKSRNNKNEIPFLSICMAYLLTCNNASNPPVKFETIFFDKIGVFIFDQNKDSKSINACIGSRTEFNKSAIIRSIGLAGISNMENLDTENLPNLLNCFMYLYLINLSNDKFDFSELLLFMKTKTQETIGTVYPTQSNNEFKNVKEYYQCLCNKLNENGYVCPDILTREPGKWEAEYFLTRIRTNKYEEFQAFKYLKDNGYFNMGICPHCGESMTAVKRTYTSGFNSNINYPICENCYNIGRGISTNHKSDSKGCYIATACYGDYEAKEVKLFRNYRDDVLSNSIWGRLFIKIYYFISPKLAHYLEKNKRLNNFIRVELLDRIYNKINN